MCARKARNEILTHKTNTHTIDTAQNQPDSNDDGSEPDSDRDKSSQPTSSDTETPNEESEDMRPEMRTLYRTVALREGSFRGRQRPQAKLLKKDKDILAKIDRQAMEIWEEDGLDSLWQLNCLTYTAAIVADEQLSI